jgi:hypothetical protein
MSAERGENLPSTPDPGPTGIVEKMKKWNDGHNIHKSGKPSNIPTWATRCPEG